MHSYIKLVAILLLDGKHQLISKGKEEFNEKRLSAN